MLHSNSHLSITTIVSLNQVVIVIVLMFKTYLSTIDLLIVGTYCIHEFIAIVIPDHLVIIIYFKMIVITVHF